MVKKEKDGSCPEGYSLHAETNRCRKKSVSKKEPPKSPVKSPVKQPAAPPPFQLSPLIISKEEILGGDIKSFSFHFSVVTPKPKNYIKTWKKEKKEFGEDPSELDKIAHFYTNTDEALEEYKKAETYFRKAEDPFDIRKLCKDYFGLTFFPKYNKSWDISSVTCRFYLTRLIRLSNFNHEKFLEKFGKQRVESFTKALENNVKDWACLGGVDFSKPSPKTTEGAIEERRRQCKILTREQREEQVHQFIAANVISNEHFKQIYFINGGY